MVDSIKVSFFFQITTVAKIQKKLYMAISVHSPHPLKIYVHQAYSNFSIFITYSWVYAILTHYANSTLLWPHILLACMFIIKIWKVSAWVRVYDMTIGVKSLLWLQRQKGRARGVNIGAEMDLMCHVIATRVRSSGFWWASCGSALHSHVRSAITFGSHVTFFVKSFSLICQQKGAPGIPTAFTPALPPPVGEESQPSCAKSSDMICIDQGWAENLSGINFLGLWRSWPMVSNPMFILLPWHHVIRMCFHALV